MLTYILNDTNLCVNMVVAIQNLCMCEVDIHNTGFW